MMRNYTWYYGLFHWLVHFSLTILIMFLSGIVIFPIYADYFVFGHDYRVNVVDYVIAILITMLIDVDHFSVWKVVGIKRAVYVQKKLISPVHNFFFISFFAILSAMTSIFISREAGVLLFVIVAHMLWDISEDVFIFRESFRRWEKTWGLNKKDLEDAYNELIKLEPPKIETPPEIKESRIRKFTAKIAGRIRRKVKATQPAS